jgi:hypothetical protein
MQINFLEFRTEPRASVGVIPHSSPPCTDTCISVGTAYSSVHFRERQPTMTYRTAMLALALVGASGLAVGQAQTPPSQDTTPPSTSTPRAPNEAPTTGNSSSRPADASSPHQRQATSKESHEKMMKDCVKQHRAENSSMSKDAAKKACEEQMKSSSSTSRY